MRPTPGQRCAKRPETVAATSRYCHILWISSWVGQRCLSEPAQDVAMLQSTTKQTHGLCLVDKMSIITLTYVVQIFPALKNTHHHASHNPQTNKQDQKGSKRYLADFSKLRTKVHGASRCGFSRIYIPPKTSKNLVVIILILALRGHIHWGREPAMPSANFGLPSQHAGQD